MRADDDFDTFFRAEFPALVGFLCKIGTEVIVARDVAADAMLLAYESWSSIEHPRAWVRGVAGRLATERARFDAGPRADWFPPAEPADDKLVTLVAQHAEIVDLLSVLPRQQRTVLAWLLDGFTPAETAQALKISPATVRSHRRHARERLRQRFPAARRPHDKR
ncbi:RNA polymerase sigma factor [Amycolatopsis sp. NPDC058986]|uniref:RNA polymerase sigma factor n=1 Tax=unclassified Amycolatopsis TaxID=2618356 RepID=UPI00366FC11C